MRLPVNTFTLAVPGTAPDSESERPPAGFGSDSELVFGCPETWTRKFRSRRALTPRRPCRVGGHPGFNYGPCGGMLFPSSIRLELTSIVLPCEERPIDENFTILTDSLSSMTLVKSLQR